MLNYIIYIIVIIILAFVILTAANAINKGLKSKENSNDSINNDKFKKKKINNDNLDVKIANHSILKEINELNKLHTKGVLSDEEFKKAKEKILS
tara:strand:+ start:1532 stop:1813 length:282 start_codon:yes stop_codon:yes gene_type:complete